MIGAPQMQTSAPGNHPSRTKPARTELSQIRMSLAGASQARSSAGRGSAARRGELLSWSTIAANGIATCRPMAECSTPRSIAESISPTMATAEPSNSTSISSRAPTRAKSRSHSTVSIGAEVASDGGALLKTAKGNLTLKRPVAYQQIDGTRRAVQADYKIAPGAKRSKSHSNHDRARRLRSFARADDRSGAAFLNALRRHHDRNKRHGDRFGGQCLCDRIRIRLFSLRTLSHYHRCNRSPVSLTRSFPRSAPAAPR